MDSATLWTTHPEFFRSRSIRQVLGLIFGVQGKLTDRSPEAQEFRSLLGVLPQDVLARFAEELMKDRFTEAGLALQEVVNELGARLGFSVIHGRHRRGGKTPNPDGFWMGRHGSELLVEVKKSDWFLAPSDLQKMGQWRESRIRTNGYSTEDSWVLLVVASEYKTDSIESVLRDSKYSGWIRLTRVNELLILLNLVAEQQLNVNEERVQKFISDCLAPNQTTNMHILQHMVALLRGLERPTAPGLTVSPPIEPAIALQRIPQIDATDPTVGAAPKSPKPKRLKAIQRQTAKRGGELKDAKRERRPSRPTQNFGVHEQLRLVMGRLFGKPLVLVGGRAKATFASKDNSLAVVCLWGRQLNCSGERYKFSVQPHHPQFVAGYPEGSFALFCGSQSRVLLIPRDDLGGLLGELNVRQKANKPPYWYFIVDVRGHDHLLHLKGEGRRVSLNRYVKLL